MLAAIKTKKPATSGRAGGSSQRRLGLRPAYRLGGLVASKQIKPVRLGELSLNGSVRPVHGMLSMADSLHQHGLYGMIVPTQNAREAATVDGPLVYGVSTLQEAVEILAGDVRQRPYELNVDDVFREHGCYPIDFAEVRGQDHAKRAREVAAGGGHNLLTLGTKDR